VRNHRPIPQMKEIMRQTSLLVVFLLATIAFAFGQQKQTEKLQNCKTKWKYSNLNKVLNGSILYYEQPVVECGILSTASVALIRTEAGDTLRVLSMCDTKKDFNTAPAFKLGERVKVTPSEKPSFRVDLMPVDWESCRLVIAYFGTIQRLK
jgi:hypothetical protein